MTKEIFNPHDHFFAEQIKDKKVAKAFFNAYLPEPFKKDVNLDSLELEQIDAKLLHRLGLPNKVADVLFKIEFKKAPAFFILHIEHQSSPDAMLPLRMLTYTTHILNNHVKQNANIKTLPPVISLMYYHGRQKPYPHPTRFIDLFEDLTPDQREYILNPILIDLSVYDDKTLSQHGAIAPIELLMKHSFDPCNYELLVQLLKALKQAVSVQIKQNGVEYMAINYDYPSKEFLDLVKEYLSEVNIMSIAEQLAQDAHNNAKKEIARNLLANGLELEFVAKNTGMTLSDIKKIKASMLPK